MSRARTACTGCALPFYSDTNESCPYCGAPGLSDARAAPGRERVTCADCGLPHYGEDCPYCATAGPNATVEAEAEADPAAAGEAEAEVEADAETASEPAAPAAESAPEAPPAGQRRTVRRRGDDGRGTLVGRVLGTVRSLFGR